MLAALLICTVLDDTWADLFDGKTLDAFVKKGGSAEYRVEGGEIVGTTVANTPNTFLCTKKDYGDFELTFEVKVHNELNSGVQIRSHSVQGYQKGTVFGYQVEIDPTTRAYSGGIYDEARRGWLDDLSDNPAGQKAFKGGEWNAYRVLADGDHIQVWVNGVKTADVRDDMDRFGFIGLQVHGVGDRADKMEVRWRNLRIRDMGVPGAKAPDRATVLLGSDGDLSKWKKSGSQGDPIGWAWKDGYMEIVPRTGSIQTRQGYESCTLHVEFAVDENNQEGQANGNSGVYLQGSYEVQILNSFGQVPADNIAGGIYRVKAPDINMAYPAYEWQTYDIEFVPPKWEAGKKVANARLTVWHNGVLVQRNVEVPGNTGSGEPETEEPDGIYLQDHGNLIKFRNIWIVPK
ncbi:MAG: DUF1080 domain-containing protein [Fimbriimonadaceae bacterium]